MNVSVTSPTGGSRLDVNQYKCVVVGDGGVGKTSMLLRFVQGDFFTEYTPTDFDSFTISMALGDEWMPCTMTLVDTAGQETYDRLRTLTYYDTDVFIVCFSLACPDSFLNVRARWIPELKEFKPKTPIILVGTQADLREKHEKKNKLNSNHNLLAGDRTSLNRQNELSKTNKNVKNTKSSISESSKNNNSSFSSRSSNSNNSTSKSDLKQDYDDQILHHKFHDEEETPSFVSYKEGKKLAHKLNARMYSECSALTGEGLDQIFYQALMTAVLPKRKRRFWQRFKKFFSHG